MSKNEKGVDERVQKIDTPEKCVIFAKNCIERGREDLAIQAKLRAENQGADSMKKRLVKS